MSRWMPSSRGRAPTHHGGGSSSWGGGAAGARRGRWHHRLRHSLRGRLVALFLLLAVGTTLVLLGGMRQALGGGFSMLVKPLLSDYVDRLAADIGSPPDLDRARALVARLPISVRIDGPQVQWASHPGRLPPSGPAGPDGPHHDGDAGTMLTRVTADGHRIHFGLGDPVWRLRSSWALGGPLLGMLLLTLAAYVTVRRLFRPLDDIRAGALRYGSGNFAVPIPVRRRDELGDLATRVNAMAGGLQSMLQGQRALLLAISHELRSPLTRARLHAELSPPTPERAALLRDLAVMSELITDLLESERLAAGSAALTREDTDLNTLVQEVVAAQFDGQPLRLDLGTGLPAVPLDRPRVRMLVRNLLDNACRHGAGAPQPVVLSTQADHGAVWLTVRDHGPGVPEDHLARLAEPFYRPDSARTRGAGGVGLGLYLCRLVMQSHGGSLTLRNASPGLEVQARWPL